MKKPHKVLAVTLVILTATLSTNLFAQVPPPPPPSHGSSGNQPGGNAPIGGGLLILLSLGVAYGGKKIYDMKKEKLEEYESGTKNQDARTKMVNYTIMNLDILKPYRLMMR